MGAGTPLPLIEKERTIKQQHKQLYANKLCNLDEMVKFPKDTESNKLNGKKKKENQNRPM